MQSDPVVIHHGQVPIGALDQLREAGEGRGHAGRDGDAAEHLRVAVLDLFGSKGEEGVAVSGGSVVRRTFRPCPNVKMTHPLNMTPVEGLVLLPAPVVCVPHGRVVAPIRRRLCWRVLMCGRVGLGGVGWQLNGEHQGW